MADDDKMTVRERRAQHAREQARKDAPKNLVRKAAVPAIIVLVLAGVAAGFYFTNKNAQDCPGHFHATFGIFIPGENGTFEKVDFARPRAPSGRAYYDFGSNGAPFSLSTHMHQSGSEQGSSLLGPSQLHFEPPTANTCVPLEDVLHALEVEVSGSGIELKGGHAQVGQDGEHRGTVTFLFQDKDGTWSNSTYSHWDGKQLPDGSSFLLAVGDYTAAQFDQMKASIPPPISRQAGYTPTTGGNHSA
jgi:hypothetical protein